MNNKAIIEFDRRTLDMKNSADLGGCYPQRPNSSYPTQPHSIIANYHLERSTQEHKRSQIRAQEQLK